MHSLVPQSQPSNLPAAQASDGLGRLLVQPMPELAKALAQAIAGCHAVDKNKSNDYHKYKYASADAIIDEGRTALAGAGLALVPIEASLTGSEREGPDRFELVRTFLLVHASGESVPIRVTWPVIPERGRPIDKATAAADTLSLSYLLRDLLLMPRVDPADEVNARDDRPPEQRQAANGNPVPARGKTPPANGLELKQRLIAREEKMVAEGLCRPGDLLQEVLRAGKKLGYPDTIEAWQSAHMQLATDTVRTLTSLWRTGPSSGQQAELDELLRQARQTWSQLRQLPATERWNLPASREDLGRAAYAEVLRLLRETVQSQRGLTQAARQS